MVASESPSGLTAYHHADRETALTSTVAEFDVMVVKSGPGCDNVELGNSMAPATTPPHAPNGALTSTPDGDHEITATDWIEGLSEREIENSP